MIPPQPMNEGRDCCQENRKHPVINLIEAKMDEIASLKQRLASTEKQCEHAWDKLRTTEIDLALAEAKITNAKSELEEGQKSGWYEAVIVALSILNEK